MVVVEDVDLIAEEREAARWASTRCCSSCSTRWTGSARDLDVTFLLTTNRADLLEPALAQRPGRVDHAALLPLPDAEARRRLHRASTGATWCWTWPTRTTSIARTEGVTAAFLKELLRRAALRAAGTGREGTGGGPIRVTDAHLTAALDQLLDARGQLTRTLLGGRGTAGQDAVIRSMGADAAIRRSEALILQPRRKPSTPQPT